MPTYISLNVFTESGIRNIKDTTKRTDAIREMAKACGATLKDVYWTLGSYDAVSLFEAPDDASMAALQATIGAAGNIRTLTLRAFSRAEMDGILAKVKVG